MKKIHFVLLAVFVATGAYAGKEPIKSGKASKGGYLDKNPATANLFRQDEKIWMARSAEHEGTGTRGGGDSHLFDTRARAQSLIAVRDRFVDDFAEVDWFGSDAAGSAAHDAVVKELLPADPVARLRNLRIDYLENCYDEDGRRRDLVFVEGGEAICVRVGLDSESFPAVWRKAFELLFPSPATADLLERIPYSREKRPNDSQSILRRSFNVSLPGAERPAGLQCGVFGPNFEFQALPMDRLNDEVEFRRHPDGRWFLRGGNAYAFCR